MSRIPCIAESELQDVNKAQVIIDKLFQQVETLAKESMDWSILYRNDNIITRQTKKDNLTYLQRSSIHKTEEVTYDQLRSLLYLNHSLNELKYIQMMKDAVLIDKITDEANVFRLEFKTPLFSADREFIELVATRENGRQFMIVSQPLESIIKIKKGHVRGAYQAWEIVREIENDSIEWICIQCSSAGGLIPSFITNYVAGKDFSHDVNSIIKYIHSNSK